MFPCLQDVLPNVRSARLCGCKRGLRPRVFRLSQQKRAVIDRAYSRKLGERDIAQHPSSSRHASIFLPCIVFPPIDTARLR